jgi:hypothetical protein
LLIPSCVISLAGGAERLVPVSVTDLAETPPPGFALPLDLAGVYNLLQTVERLERQLEGEEAHGNRANEPGEPDHDAAGPSLGDLDGPATANRFAHLGTDLSAVDPQRGSGGKK